MAKSSTPDTGFRNPEELIGTLPARDASGLLAALGDVALVLDRDGVVLDVAAGQGELANHGLAAWVGAAWGDTVTIESKPKIAELLASADDGVAVGRWRQVNHPVAGGDVPVSYLALRLGRGDRVIAIGRDLRGAAAMQQRLLQTQQSLERDYIRLRQAETRYRLLFDMAGEAMLIVDAGTRRIREANAEAHRLFERAAGGLIDAVVTTLVDPAEQDDLIAYLGAAEVADDVAPPHPALRGANGRRLPEAQVDARLFREGRTPLLLIRIVSVADRPGDSAPAVLPDIVERMPDAFVLADRNLTILSTNTAFVELSGAASIERVVGARLATWLGRPGIDLELIAGQLREHDAVRNIATVLRDGVGVEQEVEVSAVLAPTGDGPCYGFVIRSVARRLRDAPAIPRDTPRSVAQLTELVGRVPLKDIVRESTDLVERLCIEAALAYTADNRASAAEILGVSRQSLYSKLHRHGLGNLVGGDE